MTDKKELDHRESDHEKSLRQMKGLDGDAIREDHRIEKTHDHSDVFEAEASDATPRKKPSDADVVSGSGATRPADDVDLDRAA